MHSISHLASFLYLSVLNNIRIDLQLLVSWSICRLKMNQLIKINGPFFVFFYIQHLQLHIWLLIRRQEATWWALFPIFLPFYRLKDLLIISCSPSQNMFLLCPLTVPNPHRYFYVSAHVLWRRLSSIWERPYKASCSTLLALLYPLPNCSPSGITITMGTKTCKLDMPVSFSFHCTKEFMKQMVTKTWKSIQMYACCRNQGQAKRARHVYLSF